MCMCRASVCASRRQRKMMTGFVRVLDYAGLRIESFEDKKIRS